MSEYNRSAAALREAAQAITENLSWAHTPEGPDYWRFVFDRLLEHSRLAEMNKSPRDAASLVIPAIKEKVCTSHPYPRIMESAAKALADAAATIISGFDWNKCSCRSIFWDTVYRKLLNNAIAIRKALVAEVTLQTPRRDLRLLLEQKESHD